MALLCVRTGRVTARSGGSRPGQTAASGRAAPRTDAPMHLPDAPEPAAAARRRLRAERRRLQRRLEGGEEGEEEDEDGAPGADEEGDAECDDPTRRMRRSIRAFEAINNVTAPPRLHACAHTEPVRLSS